MPTLAVYTDSVWDDCDVEPPSLDDLDGFVAAATLLRNPRLARVYVFVCYAGPTTVRNVIDALDLARATAYDDVDRLEALGIVVRDEQTRPHRLFAVPFAFVDGGDVVVTPTVFHAVAASETDDDVAYFLNRYGVSRLVYALRVAAAHYAGEFTQRMAASELDVTPAEGMAIVDALHPVLDTGKEYDSFFGRLPPEGPDYDCDDDGDDEGDDGEEGDDGDDYAVEDHERDDYGESDEYEDDYDGRDDGDDYDRGDYEEEDDYEEGDD